MTTQTAGPLSEPELFNGYGHPVRLRAPLTATADPYQRVLTDRIAELWAWRKWYRSRADWGSFIELRRQHAAELRALVRLCRKARAIDGAPRPYIDEQARVVAAAKADPVYRASIYLDMESYDPDDDEPHEASQTARRRTVAGCSTCERDPDGFRPYHDASPRCESGRRSHCSCDGCF